MKQQCVEECDSDSEFWEEFFRQEELTLSSSSSAHAFQPATAAAAAPPPLQYESNCISYSPPRQLSQKPVTSNNVFCLPQQNNLRQQQEIDFLKRELANAKKHLSDLEQECLRLRKEKDQSVNLVSSRSVEKDTNLGKCGVPAQDDCGVSKQSVKEKDVNQIHLAISSKAIGIQTDKSDEFGNLGLDSYLTSQANLHDKLLGIWGFASDQNLGRNLISKLFMACPADFHFLFGHMNMNKLSKSGDYMVGQGSCNAALQQPLHSFNASEASRVSRMYYVLTKICNGLLHLESLLEPLIDLCRLENVSILCSSLSILHVYLKQLLSSGRKLGVRDNVKLEGEKTGNRFQDRALFTLSREASLACYGSFGTKSSDTWKRGPWNVDTGSLVSHVNWVSLFELLHHIAVSKVQERVRLEAVSCMNVILLRTNAHADREMYGQVPIFESMSQLLKREAGSQVQKAALQQLYLLLNCPKLLSFFCSGCKEGSTSTNDNDNPLACIGFKAILEGVADCIACNGNSIKDVELRKKALVLLAFLASSGKSGFEILVNHKLPGEKNFLMLILQLLVSEMNKDLSISSEPLECIKTRILLIREALILLNRLVSNPGSSAIALQVLTASREMASLTIDIVTRLSRKDQLLISIPDSITRQMRESEIVDLAQQLKKRVSTYLGDNVP